MHLCYLWKSWKKKVRNSKKRGLKSNVVSMYRSRLGKAEVYSPKIVKDLTITGKLKDHIVDIYFEFIQMNNLERTIIKTIEGREVTETDVWEFANVLKDLHFFAKGIVYYDDKVSSGAERIAELAHIDMIKFNFTNEIRKDVCNSIKIMLPDEVIIGDPFWIIMETSQDLNANTGNYKMIDNNILLFLSKKQADKHCCKTKNEKVFGISQQHLKILIGLQERGLCPEFSIAFPEFEQIQDEAILCYSISHERFRKYYVRGEE